jgi:hypothetical protein
LLLAAPLLLLLSFGASAAQTPYQQPRNRLSHCHCQSLLLLLLLQEQQHGALAACSDSARQLLLLLLVASQRRACCCRRSCQLPRLAL